MSAEPFAKAYEKLKQLRRHGEVPEQAIEGQTVQLRTRPQLRGLLGSFDADDGRLARLLEIVPLAHRVFGDERKAENWLKRPNPSFSGQKPIDLLQDELGTAVVREALEQIDHGIFS